MKRLFLLSLLVILLEAKNQTVKAKGTVLCEDEPLAEITVELRESDTFPNPGNLLNTVKTDSNGSFEISATHDKTTDIRPYVVILHMCRASRRRPHCFRREIMRVPKKFINSNDTFDMGRVKALRYFGLLYCPTV